MASKYDVYKSEDCSDVVMVLNGSGTDLACCGKKMVQQVEQTADSTLEKHVPIIEKVENGFKVIVGSTHHPMLENHWIQWIELIVDGKRMMAELKPGDEPVAHFCCACDDPESVTAREYCNIHGLWKGEL